MINTDPDGEVNLKLQPGNKLFNMVKRDYSTDPPTLIADDRDEMSIKVSDGAGMEVISRADEGKTPLIQPLDEKGEIYMENGRMTIRYEDGKIKVTPPKPFEGKTGPIDMRNSIAFEFVSENDGVEQKLRTSSSNRFIHFVDDKKVFSNNMDLWVSDNIETNMMKTAEDLRHKYPNIKFTFDDNAKGYYEETTAHMAQLTDQWLKDKPGIEKYTNIEFIEKLGSTSAGPGIIFISERDVNADQYLKNPIRETTSPLDIIDHEFIHVIDYVIEARDNLLYSEELTKFSDLNIEDFHKWLKEEKGITLDTSSSESQAKEYEKLKNNPEALKEYLDNYVDPNFIDLTPYEQEYNERFEDKLRKDLGTLDSIDLNLGLDISQKLLTSQKFKDFVEETQQLRLEMGITKDIRDNFNDPENPDLSIDGKIKNSQSIHRLHSFLLLQSKKESNSPEVRQKLQRFKEKYEKIISDETGLYSYSFNPPSGGGTSLNELPTTYSELPPEKARKNPQLAQLEYDRVMATDPPAWLKDKAETRYYAIMGGKKGTYCQTNGCGPCKLYKLSCKAS